MKHIKNFKLFETGEWSRNVDWQFVKDNPDDQSEESVWIRSLESILDTIRFELKDKNVFIIKNIRGFDMNQGPYALVNIFDKNYKIWMTEADDLWIQDFPIDNTSEEGKLPGYEGYWYDIVELLNEIIDAGGIDLYTDTKKYNL